VKPGVLGSKGDAMFIVNPSMAARLATVLTVAALHVSLYDLIRIFVP
jgi:hypothetical protein